MYKVATDVEIYAENPKHDEYDDDSPEHRGGVSVCFRIRVLVV